MAMKAPPVARSSILALCPASSTRFEPFKSSFLRYGVKGLKTPRLRIAHSDRLRPNCYGGGAFGSQMNFFRRFTRIIKSYVKSILYLFQSPEKILDQAVIDMNNDLIKMNQATAQVLASQKQLENRYKSAQQASEKWYGKAQLALGEGDHNLVREALKRRKSFADNASVLRVQLDHQKSVVDNLVSNTRLLESKILEAKGKKDVLKARAQSAKTSAKVSEILGDIDTTSALYAFNKMEEKVLAMESRAEAFNDLTNNDLMEQFQLLECYSIDDELEPLQKDISGSSKKGELPPGRTAVPTNTLFPFHEAEIEKVAQ